MGNEVIYAAGGIVWKKISGEYKLALVYRQRYGGKWSLPKGKVGESESWIDAAVREVEEEVGVKARILDYADTIQYTVEGVPKVVSFWHMKASSHTSKSIDTEVVEVGWFTPKEALEKIEYKEEKKILTGVVRPELSFKEQAINIFREINPVLLIKNFLLKGTRSRRLEGDLKTFREEFVYWIKEYENNDTPQWVWQVKKLLNRTESELLSGNIDIAWKNFHGAKRMFLFGLSPTELNEEAKVLRIEAVKLNEWRRKAIFSLIGESEHPRDKSEITRELLRKASSLRDEHYSNGYYKNKLTRDVYRVLLIAMISITTLTWIYFWQFDITKFINPGATPDIQQQAMASLIIGIILFGMLGGCISSIFHIRDSSQITRIPEIVNNNYVTSIRVLIGGALSFIIFVFLQSEFVGQLFELDLKPEDPFTYFAISFVAGFSERLVLRAITIVAGKDA